MTHDTLQPSLPLDQPELADLAGRALRCDDVEVVASQAREIHSGGAGAQIYKLSGEALAGGTLVPWSLVLKTFSLDGTQLEAASADVAAWDYWKREWLVYQAPWLQDLPASLVAPRCLGAAEQPGNVAWIALEDLTALDERPWPLTLFGTVAFQLGRFNGAYLTGQPIPAEPWLSRGWLRGWTERAAPLVERLPTVTDHPQVRQLFSLAQIADLLQFWQQRTAFYDALDALPRTLCHGDLFPRNGFVRRTARGTQCVAIDWAFTGPGALGEDLAPLVGAALAFFEADPASAAELEARCLAGYLSGLAAAGWHGDADDVRFGYLAALGLRFTLGALAPVLTVALDDSLQGWVEQVMGRPYAVVMANVRATMAFQLQRIAETQRLLAAR